MLGGLSYPWIYVTQFALRIVSACCFLFLLVSFVLATPIAELDLDGKSLPADWESAYLDHGKYLRGYLIAGHPYGFSVLLVLFVVAFVAQWFVGRKIKRQVEVGGAARASAHKRAHAFFIVGVLALGWLAVRFVLVGVSPA